MFLKKFFDPQASDIRAVHLLRVIHEGVSLKLFPTVLESVQPATCYCTRGEIRSKLLHTCLCSSIAFAHWTNWWSFHLRYETTKNINFHVSIGFAPLLKDVENGKTTACDLSCHNAMTLCHKHYETSGCSLRKLVRDRVSSPRVEWSENISAPWDHVNLWQFIFISLKFFQHFSWSSFAIFSFSRIPCSNCSSQ